MRIIEKLNALLGDRFNTNDELYQAIFGNIDGTELPTINNQNDFRQGAIANALEYVRGLALEFVNSSDITRSTDLTIGGWEAVANLEKFESETISQYASKFKSVLAGEKHTLYGIRQSLENFSENVTVNEGTFVSGAVDFSYVDITPYENDSIRPAVVAHGIGFDILELLITLRDDRLGTVNDMGNFVPNEPMRTQIREVTRNLVAPGVHYIIRIEEGNN